MGLIDKAGGTFCQTRAGAQPCVVESSELKAFSIAGGRYTNQADLENFNSSSIKDRAGSFLVKQGRFDHVGDGAAAAASYKEGALCSSTKYVFNSTTSVNSVRAFTGLPQCGHGNYQSFGLTKVWDPGLHGGDYRVVATYRTRSRKF